MRCEYCGSTLRPGETVHGIKFGTEDSHYNVFLPARDSAWTVICNDCGEKIYRLIYANLKTSINPELYKTFMQTR